METSLPLIIGNWKMVGLKEEGHALLSALVAAFPAAMQAEVVICPPFTLLYPLKEQLGSSPIVLGAQDCYAEEKGAFTGEISPAMLRDSGCDYVILGHSERRSYQQEASELIARKAEAAHKKQLITVICIGETEAERKSGSTMTVLARQLTESLPSSANPDNTVIAYEPVWAIGSGSTPTLEEIARVHLHLYQLLAERISGSKDVAKPVRLLYGGSVKPGNSAAILNIPHVNGVLVGGCSICAEDFIQIIQTGEGLGKRLPDSVSEKKLSSEKLSISQLSTG